MSGTTVPCSTAVPHARRRLPLYLRLQRKPCQCASARPAWLIFQPIFSRWAFLDFPSHIPVFSPRAFPRHHYICLRRHRYPHAMCLPATHPLSAHPPLVAQPWPCPALCPLPRPHRLNTNISSDRFQCPRHTCSDVKPPRSTLLLYSRHIGRPHGRNGRWRRPLHWRVQTLDYSTPTLREEIVQTRITAA